MGLHRLLLFEWPVDPHIGFSERSLQLRVRLGTDRFPHCGRSVPSSTIPHDLAARAGIGRQYLFHQSDIIQAHCSQLRHRLSERLVRHAE